MFLLALLVLAFQPVSPLTCFSSASCNFTMLTVSCTQADPSLTRLPCTNNTVRNTFYSVIISNKNFQLVPNNCFRRFQLRFLDLAKNRIQLLSNDSFKLQTTLETLILDSNEIVVLNSQHFVHNPQLRFLSLSNNRLKIIEATCLLNQANLRHINLNSNQLTNLQFLPLLNSLQNIYIDDNQLTMNSLDLSGFYNLYTPGFRRSFITRKST